VHSLIKSVIGKPEQWLIDASIKIGIDCSGLCHEVTSHFKAHVVKRHGDPEKHGAARVTDADFGKIPTIVKSPSMAIIGASRRGSLYNIYIKIEAGMTFLYFEEILNSNRNKAMRSSTLYKVTRPLSLDEVLKNVTRNNKTDVSKANILVLERA